MSGTAESFYKLCVLEAEFTPDQIDRALQEVHPDNSKPVSISTVLKAITLLRRDNGTSVIAHCHGCCDPDTCAGIQTGKNPHCTTCVLDDSLCSAGISTPIC
jgi:hypothetical protein